MTREEMDQFDIYLTIIEMSSMVAKRTLEHGKFIKDVLVDILVIDTQVEIMRARMRSMVEMHGL
jgi:hypothetical protein